MSTPAPLDDIAFLARSAHRVDVLRTLAGASMTRPNLHEETGIPQPTLGRILGAFEERHWVERADRRYALTSSGVLIYEEFADLLDAVEIVQRVGDVILELPTDRMDFDVRRFKSATVTTPRTNDVFRHVRRAEELITGGNRVRLLSDTIAPDSLAKLHDRVANHSDGDLLVESILTNDTMRTALANETMVEWIRDLLESGRAPVYLYEGSIPMILGLSDDIAFLGPKGENEIPGAVIETEDEIVYNWVQEQLDTFREESTEFTVDDLTI